MKLDDQLVFGSTADSIKDQRWYLLECSILRIATNALNNFKKGLRWATTNRFRDTRLLKIITFGKCIE